MGQAEILALAHDKARKRLRERETFLPANPLFATHSMLFRKIVKPKN
jgi:hypothetical protein